MKLSKRDLVIGNYFLYRGDYVRIIQEVDNNHMNIDRVWYQNEPDRLVDIDFLEPIHVTPEVLLDFGFVEGRVEDHLGVKAFDLEFTSYSRFQKGQECMFRLIENYQGGINFIDNATNEINYVELKYLHLVQNFLYGLYREELTVKA